MKRLLALIALTSFTSAAMGVTVVNTTMDQHTRSLMGKKFISVAKIVHCLNAES